MSLGEIIMEKNKIKFFIPVIVIIVLIAATAYKIIKNREEKLYDSLYGKIEYYSEKCYLNGDCKDTITLQDLYDLDYLEVQYDPITKEILDSKMVIEYRDDKIIIKK